jgi:hypothetical protein
VALEPSGLAQVPDADLSRLKAIPHLFVWGDHLMGHPLWSQLRVRLQAYRQRLQAQGVQVDEWDLPALGIRGNSHMLMMDDNSDELAAHIHHWLHEQGLSQGDDQAPSALSSSSP